jgi:hypothetical protein
MSVQDEEVQDGFHPGAIFANPGFGGQFDRRFSGAIRNGVNAIVFCDEDRPICMEFVGHYRQPALAEDFFGAHDRIECPES